MVSYISNRPFHKPCQLNNFRYTFPSFTCIFSLMFTLSRQTFEVSNHAADYFLPFTPSSILITALFFTQRSLPQTNLLASIGALGGSTFQSIVVKRLGPKSS